MEAVVAVSTVLLVVILSKIMQQQLPPAHRRLTVVGCFVEQLPSDFLLPPIFCSNEFFQFSEVFLAVIRDALSLSAVASCTSCLLIISLKAFWNVVMDDKPNVRLVDTHTECDGGHDNLSPFHDEVILGLAPEIGIKSCMVRCSLDVVGNKERRQFLHRLTAHAIDDATLMLILEDEAHDIFIGGIGDFLLDLIIEVRSVERRLELHTVENIEIFLDVEFHLISGGGCEGDDWRTSYFLHNRSDILVFRSEVVSPF